MNGRILFNGCEVTTAAELIARAEAVASRHGAVCETGTYMARLAGALEATVHQLCRDLETAQTRDGSARTRRSLRERIAAADGDGGVRLGHGGAR